MVNVTWEGDVGTSLSLFFHPDCHSLQYSSIPLHFLLHLGAKVICLNEVLMLPPLQFIKKKKKVISWTLLLPLQAFQDRAKIPSLDIMRSFQIRLSLSARTHTIPAPKLSPHLCWASFCMEFLASRPCLYKYHPLVFKTLPASPTGDQTIKFFSLPFYSWSAFSESQ